MSTGSLTRLDRFTNTMLLVLFAILGISGIGMLYGTWLPWLFDLHRIAGFALVILLPWKALTVYRSLLRGMGKGFDRSAVLFLSLIFAHLVLIIIVLAFLWMGRLGPYSSLGQTLIAWHWILGLLILPVLAFHVWRRWPSPQRGDFISRRGFLQLVGIAAAGLVLGELASLWANAQAEQDSPRRFTGSRGFGSFSGNVFPLTGEGTVFLDPQTWRLAVTGAVQSPLELSYADLLARPRLKLTAVIDCTSGWYSTQEWQGIPLIDLLDQAGAGQGVAGVRLVSATEYNHTYPIEEARHILLATHVSGQVLAPEHGFPLRAVVPGRRGWFWVKWITRVDVLDNPADVVGGILASPGQTLRQWK